jgi:ribose transport system ATP-binding protein
MNNDNLLFAEDISKSFGAVRALIDVDFDLKHGEIHALLGENGAGKSTLVKILAGIYSRDKGKIFLNGKEVKISNPKESNDLGIYVILQEISLINNASVGENIFLNNPFMRNGFINWRKTNNEAKKILDKLGVNIDPTKIIRNLSIADRQLVQIAKAMSHDIKVLIMDEPTSSLNRFETANLFKLLKVLKENGISIIYISHRINEVLEIADRITVFRDGKYIGTLKSEKSNLDKIIMMMIGRKLDDLFIKKEKIHGDPVLELKNIGSIEGINDISFTLYSGEILGIAGLRDSGADDIANLLFGLKRIYSGGVFVNGKKIRIKTPRSAIDKGIGLVPSDRFKFGMCKNLSVAENILMANSKSWNKIGFLRIKANNELVKDFMKKLKIIAASSNIPVNSLSGGNQQKVVLAKWLATQSKIFILHEPTFGVDIGTKSEIYSIMTELAKNKCGVLLISSDIEEVIGMSDRIISMYRGKIYNEFCGDEIKEDSVLASCSGVKNQKK